MSKRKRRGWHPNQGLWCAIKSFVFGLKTQHGRDYWYEEYWWYCERCGEEG